MRVLLVHNFYQIPGGEDTVVREELALLRRNGVDTELFSESNDKIINIFQKILTTSRMIYSLPARNALSNKLREFPADVVHIHNFFPLLTPSILDACRKVGVPTVMTLHNFRLLTPDALLARSAGRREPSLRHGAWWTIPQRIYRDSTAATLALFAMIEFHKHVGTWTRKVDCFIAPTPAVKRRFIVGGLPAERIVVKPHFLPPPLKGGEQRREGGLFVGRLDHQKGIDILLRAWTDIDYRLTIIGDGPLADHVGRRRSPYITYLGRQSRDVVQREMRAAKFLVMPSIGQEVFGMVALEAFSNSLPVICSDDTALGEMVDDGITGLTFPAGDENALADRVRWAIANPSGLARLGRRARAVYEERYTPEVNFEQLINIYRHVIQQPLADAVKPSSAISRLH